MGAGTGSFGATVNSVGGVSSATISLLPTLIASNTSSITTITSEILSNTQSLTSLFASVNSNNTSINSATSANTPNTIVARDGSGNFAASIISANLNGTATLAENVTATSNNTLTSIPTLTGVGTLTSGTWNANVIDVAHGGTGVTNATGSGSLVLSSSPALTGNPTAPTASSNDNSTTIATTAFVNSAVLSTTTQDATTEIKGKLKLAGDLGGTADLPLVLKVGESTALNISLAEKATTAATDANTISTIVKRDGSGNFAAGMITANLSGNATTATTIATSRNIFGQSFNGSADLTGVIATQYGGTGTTTSTGTGSVVLSVSPTLTGTPLAPTAAVGSNSTQIATTEFVTTITSSLLSNTTQLLASKQDVFTEVSDEFNATASQPSFTLSKTPSSRSIVKMYINGIRISKNAFLVSGTTLTYNAANNGTYVLQLNDRIQIDYFYIP